MIKFFPSVLFVVVVVLGACSSNRNVVDSNRNYIYISDNDMEYKSAIMDGKREEMIGNFAGALIAYEKAISLQPDNPVAYYAAGKLILENSDSSNPVLYAQKCVQLEGKNKWYRILEIDVSKKYANFEEVKKLYIEYYQDFPLDTESLFEVALYMHQNADYVSSLSYLDILKAEVGFSDDIVGLYIQNYLKNNNLKQVLSLIEEVLLVYPDNMKYKGLLAEFFASQKQFDRADSIYAEIIRNNQANGYIYLSMANFYHLKSNSNLELKYFRLCVDDPQVPLSKKLEFMLYVSDLFTTNDSLMYEVLTALELSYPDDPNLNATIARLHIKAGNFSLARLYLRKALQVYNNDYNQWIELLNIDTQLDMFTELEADATSAIELFPNQPLLYLYLGIAKMHFEKFIEAESYLEMGKSLSFDNTQLLIEFNIQLGEVYHRSKKFAKSDQAFNFVLQQSPNNYPIMNNYAYYLALRSSNLDLALMLIDKALVDSPNQLNYIDTKAWILYKMGKYADAMLLMEAHFDFNTTTNAVVLEHYGDILYRNGNTDSARKAWNRCIELGRDNEIIRTKLVNGLN